MKRSLFHTVAQQFGPHRARLELIEFRDERFQAFSLIDLGQPLLLIGGRDDAMKLCDCEISAARNPEAAVREFNAADETGHAFDGQRLSAALWKFERGVLEDLALLAGRQVQLRGNRSGQKLAPTAVLKDPAKLHVFDRAIRAVPYLHARRASFLTGDAG